MFDHSEYRRFWNERQSKEARNFIDGDLIETFLDLKKHDMDAVCSTTPFPLTSSNTISLLQVAEMVKTPADEIYKMVENLSKLH